MRIGVGTLVPSHKDRPSPLKGVLVKLWYCACVLPNRSGRGTEMRYHKTLFYVTPIILCRLILTLYVCPSVVVEWSKALVGLGSQLAVAKIFFFLFRFFRAFLGEFQLVGSWRTDLGSFFLKKTYRNSVTSRILLRVHHVGFSPKTTYVFRELACRSARNLRSEFVLR